jgi:hypothetical protein
MQPMSRFVNLCNRQYVVGETYPLIPYEGRSQASHSHYFACVTEGWRNLPEILAERFPTVEHLRKYALIKTGYADERSFVCKSRAEAIRLAAFLEPIDNYAIIDAREATVKVYTAQSQSRAAMGARVFGESKTAVLQYISQLIGTDVTSLSNNARTAA